MSATAISAASPASPARAASTTMRASRGGSARPAMALPSSLLLPLGVERAKRSKQRPRLLERGARRGIEKPQPARIGDTPYRKVEQQAGEVGGENLGRREGVRPPVAASSHSR